MCASNSHSYTHLIQALCIVRKPTLWGFITSKYPGTHDIGLATGTGALGFLFLGFSPAGVVRTKGAAKIMAGDLFSLHGTVSPSQHSNVPGAQTACSAPSLESVHAMLAWPRPREATPIKSNHRTPQFALYIAHVSRTRVVYSSYTVQKIKCQHSGEQALYTG